MVREEKQKILDRPPVKRQLVGAALGAVMAFTEGYAGMQLVVTFLCEPVLIAGLIRLLTGLYRTAKNLTAQKAYNEFGECVMMIHRKGISVLLTIAGLIGVLYVLTGAFQFSYAAGVVVTLLLMAWEVFTLLKDIRNLQIWKEQNGVV